MLESRNNIFSINYLRKIFLKAIEHKYSFLSMTEYHSMEYESNKKYFILRLDLDLKPERLIPIIKLTKDLNIPLTIFVRVSGPYNFLWYPNYQAISFAEQNNAEIGLHTNPVEWDGIIKQTSIKNIFESELFLLRSKFNISGVAPHRDIDYCFNSLPWLEDNWAALKKEYSLKYHAYEEKFFENFIYINEGFNPHLTWRNSDPFDIIEENKNIYMLLHPHWWHEDHPFET